MEVGDWKLHTQFSLDIWVNENQILLIPFKNKMRGLSKLTDSLKEIRITR